MGEDATGHPPTQRVSVDEAARRLGLSVDAIRKRVARGTIRYERGEHGRVWVILDADQDTASKVQDTDKPQSDTTALISAKDETIATLREQLEAERQGHAETRRLLLEALTKIPAAIEPPGGSETATDAVGREEPFTSEERLQEASQRPWYRRWFGT